MKFPKINFSLPVKKNAATELGKQEGRNPILAAINFHELSQNLKWAVGFDVATIISIGAAIHTFLKWAENPKNLNCFSILIINLLAAGSCFLNSQICRSEKFYD